MEAEPMFKLAREASSILSRDGLFSTGNLHDIEKIDKHITVGRRIWSAE